MNVSGHRISTSEVESALVNHHGVAEAAVVGAADETTGQGIVAFVILREASRTPATSSSPNSSSGLHRHQPHRQAASDHDRAGTAEDPVRQDHAPPPARRRRRPRPRRHLDPGRPQGIRRHPRQVGPSAPVRLFGSPHYRKGTQGRSPSRNFTSSFDVSQDSSATRMSAATLLCKDFPREERNTRTFRRSSSPTSR